MPLQNNYNSENTPLELKAQVVLPNGNGSFTPCPKLLTEDEAIRYLRLDVNGPREADGFLAAQIYRKGSTDRKLSDWARAQIANHCKTIFRVAVRGQWIAKNPFADIRKPKPIVKKWHRLAVDDYYKLLNAAPTLRWKCFYALVYTSGARFGELFNLTWADIDFEQGHIYIRNREGSDCMPPFWLRITRSDSFSFPTTQWSLWDSNPRPLACHASALPTELRPQN